MSQIHTAICVMMFKTGIKSKTKVTREMAINMTEFLNVWSITLSALFFLTLTPVDMDIIFSLKKLTVRSSDATKRLYMIYMTKIYAIVFSIVLKGSHKSSFVKLSYIILWLKNQINDQKLITKKAMDMIYRGYSCFLASSMIK